MPKERVVVFDGEDNFISPRNVSYDIASGEAQVVGAESPKLPDNPVSSGAKKEFDDYMLRQGKSVSIPNPADPEFCLRIRQFIQSNGDGLATPEQVMEAHSLFQNNCVEKPKSPIAPPVEEPANPKDYTPIEPSPNPQTPTNHEQPITLTNTFVPLNVPTLGRRPSGVSEEKSEENKSDEKTSINWLIWLIIGGIGLYLITRKND